MNSIARNPVFAAGMPQPNSAILLPVCAYNLPCSTWECISSTAKRKPLASREISIEWQPLSIDASCVITPLHYTLRDVRMPIADMRKGLAMCKNLFPWHNRCPWSSLLFSFPVLHHFLGLFTRELVTPRTEKAASDTSIGYPQVCRALCPGIYHSVGRFRGH